MMNVLKRLLVLLPFVLLVACSSTDPRRIPAPLVKFSPSLTVQTVWTSTLGNAKKGYISPILLGDDLFTASSKGKVEKIDVETGKVLWQTKVASHLSAGVGADGRYIAVADEKGQIYVLDADGKIIWSTQIFSNVISSPLVGHGMVLVRTIDGKVFAFDANTGAQKWVYHSRETDLSLHVPVGMVFAGSNAVLLGFSGGTLAVINLENGQPFWQQPISYPNGVTEVERINDVTGYPILVNNIVCATTYQGTIGCYAVSSGEPLWNKAFSSASGISQNTNLLVSVDEWSELYAFAADTGQVLWHNDAVKNRRLTRPLVTAQWIVAGDCQGYVYFFSKQDGHLLARIKTDGTPIRAMPILDTNDQIIVMTYSGKIYALRATEKE